MLRKSKRLLDRSASDSLENDDPGGGVMENTPFIDAGSAGPIIVDPSAAMIPLDIVMEDGAVTVANTSSAAGEGAGDVVVAEIDFVEEEVVECGVFDVVETVVESGDNDNDGDTRVIGGRKSRAKTEKEERAERSDQSPLPPCSDPRLSIFTSPIILTLALPPAPPSPPLAPATVMLRDSWLYPSLSHQPFSSWAMSGLTKMSPPDNVTLFKSRNTFIVPDT